MPNSSMEKVIVVKDRGDHRPIIFTVLVADLNAIEDDASCAGRVEAGEHLHEGRLAGTVASSHKHEFAGAHGEIDGADLEPRLAGLVGITEVHLAHFNGFEWRRRYGLF